MAYTDFTLDTIEQRLGLTLRRRELFTNLVPVAVPKWLVESIARNRVHVPLLNEKARSEVYVAPILLAAAELGPAPLTIFSGQRLDADPARSLVGECDFIMARTEAIPRLKAPILTVVEAKKADLELALGQCIAQMEGATVFNRAADNDRPIYGCVTSGEVWQFLHQSGNEITLDESRYFSTALNLLLAVLRKTLE